MVIRPATIDDAAPMADLWLHSRAATLPTVRNAHPDDDVRAWFHDTVVPLKEAWVADEGGIIALLVLDGPWVSQLYVAPTHLRQGIGTRLLNLAKHLRPTGLQLWTFQINTPAQAFYLRHGFTEVERTDGSGNEEHEPDIRYQWHPATMSSP